jgi:hypothetical protein
MTDDLWERELAELLEWGEPVRPLGAGARPRAVAAMQRSVAQPAADSLLDRILGKGEKKMRRFAYAVAVLVLVGAAAAGVFTRSDPVDGRALLIGAAEAMAEAETVHLWGHGSKGSPEGTVMSEDSYERWYAPQGSRTNSYDPEGNLKAAWVFNAELGLAWYYSSADTHWFADPIVQIYRTTPREMADSLEGKLERYVSPELAFAQEKAWGNAVTVREEERDGKTVTIVEVIVRDDAGATFVTKVSEIDPATGYLMSSHTYGPEMLGSPPLGFFEVLDYGSPPPAGLFEFETPPGAIEIEGLVVRHPSGIDLPNTLFFRPKVPARDDWRAFASPGSGSSDPQFAIDGDSATAWTGRGKHHLQEPGMWIQVDFGTPVSASRLTVHHAADPILGPSQTAPPADDAPRTGGAGGAGMMADRFYADGSGYPRGLQVSVTADGKTWEDVPTGLTRSDLPTGALFGPAREIVGIRLTLTESSDEAPWTITEIRLYE